MVQCSVVHCYKLKVRFVRVNFPPTLQSQVWLTVGWLADHPIPSDGSEQTEWKPFSTEGGGGGGSVGTTLVALYTVQMTVEGGFQYFMTETCYGWSIYDEFKCQLHVEVMDFKINSYSNLLLSREIGLWLGQTSHLFSELWRFKIS